MTLAMPTHNRLLMITAALSSCAVLALCAAFASPARAQPAPDSPDVDACATQIYRGLRPLSDGPVDRVPILRTLLHTLSHAPACHLPADLRRALRLSYRRAGLSGRQLASPSGQAFDERYERATRRALSRSHRSECALGANSNEAWIASRACHPVAPGIRDLVTDSSEHLFAGGTRLLVVQVVDTLAASTPRLLASAQLVWMAGSWMGNGPLAIEPIWESSDSFRRMMADLRARHVRFESYPTR